MEEVENGHEEVSQEVQVALVQVLLVPEQEDVNAEGHSQGHHQHLGPKKEPELVEQWEQQAG